MRLLALDTATSAVTVAVHDGTRVLARREVVDPRRHTEVLSALVAATLADAALEPSDLTDIAVGVGPGPFTGLRVGLVTARVMGHALGIDVHGVVSLDALAHAAAAGGARGQLVVATDARRREVYLARYVLPARAGCSVERVGGPEVVRPADVPEEVRALPCIGRGPCLYPEAFPQARQPLDVDAAALAEVALLRLRDGVGEDPGTEPLYLRRPDALTSAQRAGIPAPRGR